MSDSCVCGVILWAASSFCLSAVEINEWIGIFPVTDGFVAAASLRAQTSGRGRPSCPLSSRCDSYLQMWYLQLSALKREQRVQCVTSVSKPPPIVSGFPVMEVSTPSAVQSVCGTPASCPQCVCVCVCVFRLLFSCLLCVTLLFLRCFSCFCGKNQNQWWTAAWQGLCVRGSSQILWNISENEWTLYNIYVEVHM